jgi:hypothetical protein
VKPAREIDQDGNIFGKGIATPSARLFACAWKRRLTVIQSDKG